MLILSIKDQFKNCERFLGLIVTLTQIIKSYFLFEHKYVLLYFNHEPAKPLFA